MPSSNSGQFGDSLIKNLIAPLTVAAISENTLKTFSGYFGGAPMPADGGGCEEILARYPQLGIDLKTFAGRVQDGEAAALISSWIELFDAVARKSADVPEVCQPVHCRIIQPRRHVCGTGLEC